MLEWHAGCRALRRLRVRFGRRRPIRLASAFDQAYGVATAGELPWQDLGSGSATDAFVTEYDPSPPLLLRCALARLPERDRFTFLDLGCGKARALIIASEFNFKAIVGIEKSPGLAAIAAANAAVVAKHHPERPRLRVIEADAANCPLPAGNLVVYLYNPFLAPVLAVVAERIQGALQQEPRQLYVVYLNPVLRRLFDACPELEAAPELAIAAQCRDEGRIPAEIAVWRARLRA
ncbi:MAG: hypothetical protein GC191_04160 [Azospirillum sp.]|nr:hypothetical protein [Azospirillum sp.]